MDDENKKDWDLKLDLALVGIHKTSYKVTIGFTPFKMAYGLEAIVSMDTKHEDNNERETIWRIQVARIHELPQLEEA